MADFNNDTKRFLKKMLKDKADKNNDNFLDELEICLAFAECGCTVKREQLSFIKKALDTNGDGKIHIDELVENLDAMVIHDIRGEELMKAFELFDRDKSGSIRRYELQQILTSPGDYSFDPEEANELLDEMFDEYDVNKDDKLSYPEFVRLFTEGAETKFKFLQEIVDSSNSQQTKK